MLLCDFTNLRPGVYLKNQIIQNCIIQSAFFFVLSTWNYQGLLYVLSLLLTPIT